VSLAALTVRGGAQSPAVTTTSTTTAATATASQASRVITAEEGAADFNFWKIMEYDRRYEIGEDLAGTEQNSDLPWTTAPFEGFQDSVRLHSQAWLGTLRTKTQRGLQLDAMGSLFVHAGDDAIAQQQFAARLATPKLSTTDQAYTLLIAARAFSADENNLVRLAVAQKYVDALDTLSDTMHLAQYRAHEAMVHAYYLRRDTSATIHEIEKLYNVFPSIPFLYRLALYRHYLCLGSYIDMMMLQPRGKQRIDSVMAYLRTIGTPSQALVAQSPLFRYYGAEMVGIIDQYKPGLDLLGTRPAGVIATHWYGMPVPKTVSSATNGARTLTLNDGVIRVVELGTLNCPHCLGALPVLKRLRAAAPKEVQFLYVTQTLGSWGADLLPPDREAEMLRHYYLDKYQLGVPLAVWAGPKVLQDDGGMIPTASPNTITFTPGTPTFVILDGHGVIRHFGPPGDPKGEATVLKKLRALVAEAREAGANVGVSH